MDPWLATLRLRSPMPDTLLLGAVAYDAKVVTIWDDFQRWYVQHGLAFDYVLFSNYERQVEQHFAGALHVAWNSPLAWLQTERLAAARGRHARAVAMRDTDQDRTSLFVVRAGNGIDSVAGLRGKRVGVGAVDSPRASLIPLEHLAEQGLSAERDFEVRRFDVVVGKHGDHVGGERDAARALMVGEVDAACMSDGNHLLFTQDGTLPREATHVLAQTAPYDHCNFTALDHAPAALLERFSELLLGMRQDDPEARQLLDLQGLTAWRPGRTNGHAQLAHACDRFGVLRPFLRKMGVE
jgi:phosphonate transport system substrate-binding protein